MILHQPEGAATARLALVRTDDSHDACLPSPVWLPDGPEHGGNLAVHLPAGLFSEVVSTQIGAFLQTWQGEMISAQVAQLFELPADLLAAHDFGRTSHSLGAIELLQGRNRVAASWPAVLVERGAYQPSFRGTLRASAALPASLFDPERPADVEGDPQLEVPGGASGGR